MPPLFHLPVEILANSRKFYYWDGSVLGLSPTLINFELAADPIGISLSLNQRLALSAEDILRCFVRMKKGDSANDRKLALSYFRTLRTLEFIRSAWDGLLCGLQLARQKGRESLTPWVPNADDKRQLGRIKRRLVMRPLDAAKLIKQWASDSRMWYFRTAGITPPFSFSRREALAFSYAARAMPPPPFDDTLLPALRARLSSAPPLEHPMWRQFVTNYLQRWKPRSMDEDLWTQSSNHAAIGYPRALGGHIRAVQDIVYLGLCDMALGPNPPPYLSVFVSQQLDKDKPILLKQPPLKGTWASLMDWAGGIEPLQKFLERGVVMVLDVLSHVPVLPIYAEEKGLKVRYPTCTLTAVNLVQQVLRRSLDQVLTRDPRLSESMGGTRKNNLRGERGPWYSQDATAATDYHSTWLTQTVYEELAKLDPRIQKWQKYFHLLFGPKLLLAEEITSFDLIAPGVDQEVDAKYRKLFSDRPRYPLFSASAEDHVPTWEASAFRFEYINWLTNLMALPGSTVTSIGQMMGDPTSFPVMPLVSMFSLDQAFKAYPVTRTERRRRPVVPGLRAQDPRGLFCGDDALLPSLTEERRIVYDTEFIALGGRLQPLKSFFHHSKGLFCERPYKNGGPEKFQSVSVWSAPPGGSKGQITWYGQPGTAVDRLKSVDIAPKRGLWGFTPFYHHFAVAYQLGIPVGAPVGHGGLNHPGYPAASRTNHYQWLTTLNSMSISELAGGTGLAILPGPSQALSSGGRSYLRTLEEERDKVKAYNATLPFMKTVTNRRTGEIKTVEIKEPRPLPWVPGSTITPKGISVRAGLSRKSSIYDLFWNR
jgi:hypothetical protein